MFADQTDAGRQLAEVLDRLDVDADLVLAIPRGGLPVERAVADKLSIPLDIVAARKIGAPGNPELALGAVASDGTTWLNDTLLERFGLDESDLRGQIDAERGAARGKVDRYRADRPPLSFEGKRILLVDDGIATGATAIACPRELAAAGVDHPTVAVPVGPPDTLDRLRDEADEVISVSRPTRCSAVGQFYRSFPQVFDEEAKATLRGE